jgi:hypothetical protein
MVKRDIMVSYTASVLAKPPRFDGPVPTCNNNLGLKVSLFEPLNSLGELGVAPLVREVASVYQDIALWQLDSGIMGVADAHDPGPACETRSQ